MIHRQDTSQTSQYEIAFTELMINHFELHWFNLKHTSILLNIPQARLIDMVGYGQIKAHHVKNIGTSTAPIFMFRLYDLESYISKHF